MRIVAGIDNPVDPIPARMAAERAGIPGVAIEQAAAARDGCACLA